jgi:predicted  nucleic acid-binding Zn-ribbon protein
MEDEKELKKGQKAYLRGVVNDFKENAKKALDSIENLKSELIKGEAGSPSLIEQFKKAETDLKKIKEEIVSIHSSIFDTDDNDAVLADDIEKFRDDFEKRKKEIESIHDNIASYEIKLLGVKNDDGTEIKGIQHKIEEQVKVLTDLHKTNFERQEKLFQKIESLLKGASTVALAKSFNEHKESFNKSNSLWVKVFIGSIVSMMGLSVWGFIDSNHNLDDLWKHTLGNLPFLAGAIWLAVFASKQRSQNIRLQQEYAYKEDVAKIYYGLKQEIEELGETDLGARLNEQMLSIILETVSYNPSETLESNSHNDKGPMLETLNNMAQSIKDLKK